MNLQLTIMTHPLYKRFVFFTTQINKKNSIWITTHMSTEVIKYVKIITTRKKRVANVQY